MLFGNKVYLRPMTTEDINTTMKWRNDVSLRYSTMSHPYPVTIELEKEWIHSIVCEKGDSRQYFSICTLEGDEMVGYVFLYDISLLNGYCSWGGLIGDPSNRQKGYGSEAVKLIIKFAFANLNMHKVYARVLSNHPAVRKWKSFGAVEEGLLKEHFCRDLKYRDVLILAWYPEPFYAALNAIVDIPRVMPK